METAKTLGVDQFVVDTPFDVSWDDPNVHPAAGVAPFHLELEPNTEQMLGGNWECCIADEAVEIFERELDCGWAGRRVGPDRRRTSAAAAHTCSWLYKSMTLDANGRILPCAGAPKAGVDVVFGSPADGYADSFNSEHYLQARRLFGDRLAYEAVRASGGPSPHCANCEWDQDLTEFGALQVAQYLRTAGRGTVEPQTIEVCSNW
jgi:hypothetical protein